MTIDLKAIAQGAIVDLQTAADSLSIVVPRPGADAANITAMIDTLRKKQADLMHAILSAEILLADETAMNAANVAAVKLKEEAKTITTVEDTVQTARRVIEHASDLVCAIVPPTPWPTPGRGKK